MRANELEIALSRDRLACLAPPDTFYIIYIYTHVPSCMTKLLRLAKLVTLLYMYEWKRNILRARHEQVSSRLVHCVHLQDDEMSKRDT